MATIGIMVTLPRNGSNFKFPNNKMYSYVIRLRMEEGLSNTNLPDMYLEMSILKDLNMFELKTVRNYIGKNVEVPKNSTAILCQLRDQSVERRVSWN